MIHKHAPLVGLALIALLCAFSVGCASSGAGPAMADVPPEPVKKPFEAPAFDATKWHSEEHGFSVHYPSDFQPDSSSGSLFTAASPSMAPRIDVTVVDGGGVGGASLETVSALLVENFKQIGGGEAKVIGSKETILQDGVTGAMEFVVDWQFQGAFPLQSVVLVASDSGEDAINVTVTNMAGADLDELREIAYTLYFE